MTMKSTLILGLLFAGCYLDINALQQQKPPDKNQGTHQTRHPFQESEEKRAAKQIVRQNTEFAFKMYRDMAQKSKDKNLFFSPLSASTGFSMLTLGAKDYTLSQLTESLNLQKVPTKTIYRGFHYLVHSLNQHDRHLKLHLGNTLFMEDQLRVQKRFLDDVKSIYEAETVSTDFNDPQEAITQINNYVSQKTQGKINNLIKNVDPGTMLLLISHIYFQGEWEKKFNTKDTKEGDFFLINGKSVKVPMMYRGGKYKTAYDEQLSCTILEIPFKGNVTGLFILPDKGKLQKVEEGLCEEKLAQWRRSLKCSSVDVSLPKFSISGTYDMRKCLSGLGVTRIFQGSADLTRISPQKNLKVSQAIHKAVLKMDENGAEAAGGTGIETLPMTVPQIIKFKEPFLMLVLDSPTQSVLFVGKIMNPK
ncbi:serpin A12 [Trichosurus vulpecula]|uniref:serpin A12 n=1 Tax=Trichosurus vulpecula TaxID=9337 RepID=UPI00186ADF9E|nr:serpin A12 [Trichosurus vulpecula]